MRHLAFAILLLSQMFSVANAREIPYTDAALKEVGSAGKPYALVFHANWCPTCRAQAPILKELSETDALRNVTILIADFDKELALRGHLHVTKQSTVVVFRNGEEVARSIGSTERADLLALLRQALP